MKKWQLTVITILLTSLITGSCVYYLVNSRAKQQKTDLLTQIDDLNNQLKDLDSANRSPHSETDASQIGIQKLTVDMLLNATYQDVKLNNGIYYDLAAASQFQSPKEDYVTELDTNHVAFGDLNSDKTEDAAIILSSRSGGSGTFYTLNAVLNDSGNPQFAAALNIGDRAKISSLEIKSNLIYLSYQEWQNGDYLPEKTNIYALSDKRLILQ